MVSVMFIVTRYCQKISDLAQSFEILMESVLY
jgi:hypothetical protein